MKPMLTKYKFRTKHREGQQMKNTEKSKKTAKHLRGTKKVFIFAAQSVDGRNMVARLLVSRLRVRLPSPIQERGLV